jgi:hypothetical protein
MRENKSIWILLGLAAIVTLILLACPQIVEEPAYEPTPEETAKENANAILNLAGTNVSNFIAANSNADFDIIVVGTNGTGYVPADTSYIEVIDTKYNNKSIPLAKVQVAVIPDTGGFTIRFPVKSIIEADISEIAGNIVMDIRGVDTSIEDEKTFSDGTKSVIVEASKYAKYSGTLSSLLKVAKLLKPATAGGLINSMDNNPVITILSGSVGTLWSGQNGNTIVPLVFDGNMPSVTFRGGSEWILAGSVGTLSKYRDVGSFAIGGSVEVADIWMGGTLAITDIGSGSNTEPDPAAGTVNVYFGSPYTGGNANGGTKIVLDAAGFPYELPSFGVRVTVY